MRTAFAILAVAALAACTQETTTEVPDTTAQMEAPAMEPAPTVVMITESDARTRFEGAGYTNVTGLTQNPDGSWTATGMRDGASTQVMVGEGGVTVVTTP